MKRLFIFLVIVFLFVHTSKLESAPAKHKWDVNDSKAYAKDAVFSWSQKEWKCLDKLWTKESNWRPEAYNSVKVMGRNAGGIPQILGLSPDTNPTDQIDRGISYVLHRYGTPCMAWKHWQKNGWY